MTVLLLADHDNKTLGAAVAKAMSAAKGLGQDVHVLVAGADCRSVAEAAANFRRAIERRGIAFCNDECDCGRAVVVWV